MHKFSEVKLGDKIYSVVYGTGNVIFVLEKERRLDGYFVFEVEYKDGCKVHYTEDGKPGWCRDINLCASTIFYRDDIDVEKFDSTAVEIPLKRYEIISLREKYLLEMISPAGHWIDASLMPDLLVDKTLAANDLQMFREMKTT
jgi:hypothetical protein